MELICNAKLAALLAPNQIAISCGTNEGVELGDIVTIRQSVEITDPDTQEPLGSVLMHVAKLKVSLAMEKASVAYITDKVAQPLGSTLFGSLSGSLLKGMTLSKIEADAKTVWVQVGWPVSVERPDQRADIDQ